MEAAYCNGLPPADSKCVRRACTGGSYAVAGVYDGLWRRAPQTVHTWESRFENLAPPLPPRDEDPSLIYRRSL